MDEEKIDIGCSNRNYARDMLAFCRPSEPLTTNKDSSELKLHQDMLIDVKMLRVQPQEHTSKERIILLRRATVSIANIRSKK